MGDRLNSAELETFDLEKTISSRAHIIGNETRGRHSIAGKHGLLRVFPGMNINGRRSYACILVDLKC